MESMKKPVRNEPKAVPDTEEAPEPRRAPRPALERFAAPLRHKRECTVKVSDEVAPGEPREGGARGH